MTHLMRWLTVTEIASSRSKLLGPNAKTRFQDVAFVVPYSPVDVERPESRSGDLHDDVYLMFITSCPRGWRPLFGIGFRRLSGPFEFDWLSGSASFSCRSVNNSAPCAKPLN